MSQNKPIDQLTSKDTYYVLFFLLSAGSAFLITHFMQPDGPLDMLGTLLTSFAFLSIVSFTLLDRVWKSGRNV